MASATKTSWTVAGVGALVSALGAKGFKGRFGAGVVGFGLAHVVLGILDGFRTSVKG